LTRHHSSIDRSFIYNIRIVFINQYTPVRPDRINGVSVLEVDAGAGGQALGTVGIRATVEGFADGANAWWGPVAIEPGAQLAPVAKF